MCRGVLGVGVLLAALGVARTGSAEQAVDEPAAPERWYGWQTLTADGAAAMMAAGALATRGEEASPSLWALGAGTFSLAPPIVHLTHHRPFMALGDFALRVGLPFAGLAVGAQFVKLRPCMDIAGPCEESDPAPMIAGGLMGAAVASALDAAVFTYEPAKGKWASTLRRRPLVSWSANVAITPVGSRVSVAGAF